jgi:hypothetical protein
MSYFTLKKEHERQIWKHPIDIQQFISKEWFQYIVDHPDKPWEYSYVS